MSCMYQKVPKDLPPCKEIFCTVKEIIDKSEIDSLVEEKIWDFVDGAYKRSITVQAGGMRQTADNVLHCYKTKQIKFLQGFQEFRDQNKLQEVSVYLNSLTGKKQIEYCQDSAIKYLLEFYCLSKMIDKITNPRLCEPEERIWFDSIHFRQSMATRVPVLAELLTLIAEFIKIVVKIPCVKDMLKVTQDEYLTDAISKIPFAKQLVYGSGQVKKQKPQQKNNKRGNNKLSQSYLAKIHTKNSFDGKDGCYEKFKSLMQFCSFEKVLSETATPMDTIFGCCQAINKDSERCCRLRSQQLKEEAEKPNKSRTEEMHYATRAVHGLECIIGMKWEISNVREADALKVLDDKLQEIRVFQKEVIKMETFWLSTLIANKKITDFPLPPLPRLPKALNYDKEDEVLYKNLEALGKAACENIFNLFGLARADSVHFLQTEKMKEFVAAMNETVVEAPEQLTEEETRFLRAEMGEFIDQMKAEQEMKNVAEKAEEPEEPKESEGLENTEIADNETETETETMTLVQQSTKEDDDCVIVEYDCYHPPTSRRRVFPNYFQINAVMHMHAVMDDEERKKRKKRICKIKNRLKPSSSPDPFEYESVEQHENGYSAKEYDDTWEKEDADVIVIRL